MSAASIMVMPAREAYPSDIEEASVSPLAKLVYSTLANRVYHPKRYQSDPRPYDGIVWMKRETICTKTGLSDSTVRRAIHQLIAEHWICLPAGDAGGRGQALRYHLHSTACDCHLPKAPLKQRESHPKKEAERVSDRHPLEPSFLPTERLSGGPERLSNSSGRDQKAVRLTAASITIRKETISLTTAEQAIAPKTSETLVSAPIPLCGERFSQASNQKNSSSLTTAVEATTNPLPPKVPPAPLPHAALVEAVKACAAQIYQNHPSAARRIPLSQVEKSLRGILGYQKLTGEPALAYLRTLADRHGGWCRCEQWKKQNGRFAKGLSGWLEPKDELYTVDCPEQTAPASPEPRGLRLEEIE